MGFSRYGQDVYIDDTQLDKSDMLKQLALIEPELYDSYTKEMTETYGDEFYKPGKSFAAKKLNITLSGSFSYVDDETQPSDVGDWLKDFMYQLQTKGLSSTDTSTFRDMYVNGINDGTDFGSMQEALSIILGFYFSQDSKNIASLTEDLEAAFKNAFGETTELVLFALTVGNWGHLDKDGKQTSLDNLWEKIMTEKVLSHLTEEEIAVLKPSYYTLADFLFRYLYNDYTFSFSEGVSLKYTGSFINNITAILYNHYGEITFSWLRTMDSYYANETEVYAYDTDNIPAPTVTPSIEAGYYESSQSLTIDGGKGAMVYYATSEDGETYTPYTLLRGSLALDGIENEIKTYYIKAYSMRYDKASDSAELEYTIDLTPTTSKEEEPEGPSKQEETKPVDNNNKQMNKASDNKNNKTGNAENVTGVKTGDETYIELWLAVMGAAAISAAVVCRRKFIK